MTRSIALTVSKHFLSVSLQRRLGSSMRHQLQMWNHHVPRRRRDETIKSRRQPFLCQKFLICSVLASERRIWRASSHYCEMIDMLDQTIAIK